MSGTIKKTTLTLIRTATAGVTKDGNIAPYPPVAGPELTRAATARGKLDGANPKVHLDAFIGDTTKTSNGIKFTLEATPTPAEANQTRTIKWVATPDFSAFDKAVVKDSVQALFESEFNPKDFIVTISMPTPAGTAYDRSQTIDATMHNQSLGGSPCSLTQ